MLRKNRLGIINDATVDLFLPVNFFRYLFFSFLLLAVSFPGAAQEEPPTRRGSRIIDDTTRQIYGPNTSRYYFENDVFYNRQQFYPIDTLIKDFHRWNYVQRFNNLYQDLGNIGTAIQPIYYQAPDVIGANPGAHVYDLYWDTEPVKYYDTKSPYSNMRVILGGKGRSLTKATYSRNITPQWNFGFTYRGLFIDKQVARANKGDRVVRGNYYDLYTAYESKDSTYRLFLNFRRSFHRVEEFGGIQLDDPVNFTMADFADVNARPWLINAESNDLRNNIHLFHQYKVGTALQLYHVADFYRQKNKYIDISDVSADAFYDYVEIAGDTTNDITYFKVHRQEVGIKGNLAKLFYNGYYAYRNYLMSSNHFSRDLLVAEGRDVAQTSGSESYLGGRMSLKLDSLVEVNAALEVMQTGNYRAMGEIRSRWFEARLKQIQYAPGFVEQVYRGAHDFWANNFADVSNTQLNGYLKYNSKVFTLWPGLTFTRLRNYVFYKQQSQEKNEQQVLPMQSSGSQVIASPEVRMSLTFLRHVTLSGRGIYTSMIENADGAIQVPELFVNGQLSYANIFFNGNFDIHTGVDVHWKSDYYAPGYDPAIRQFYIQNTFKIPGFPIIDIFIDAKIKRGRVFFKYNNLMQVIKKSGYLPTPYYPGQANVIDFGFDWSFYD